MVSDTELLNRFVQSGCQQSAEELTKRYYSKLVGKAFRILGHSEDAHDVAQKSMMHLYRNAVSLSDTVSVGAALMQSTIHYCIDILRWRKRQRTFTAGSCNREDYRGVRPEVKASENECRQLFWEFFDSLPPDLQELVELICIDRMSYRKAAKIVRLDRETIERRISRLGPWVRSFEDTLIADLQVDLRTRQRHSKKVQISAA